jgi:signal transduction histidine kinase
MSARRPTRAPRPLTGALLLAAAAVAGGLAVAAVHGASDGVAVGVAFALCGAPVVALAHLFARWRGRVGGLGRQFVVGIALAIGLSLALVATIAGLMIFSSDDAVAIAVLLALAGALAAYAAAVIAAAVMADIERVRAGLMAVGEGDAHAVIETSARDELGELAERANSMIRKLDQREMERDAAEQARRSLIAAVSHDLRTPLASLQVLAEAIEDGFVDEETERRYLERMSINVRSLGALIDDLFELSRLEAGDIAWSMQRVRVDELVEETVEAVQAQAERKGVAVEACVPAGLVPAQANPEKLQRVLFNLVQNAIRHTPEDGSVTIAASAGDGEIQVEVRDTGEGVDPAERDRVFEPFYRAGSEESRTRSSAGLGLTICRAIVEAHGGRIWLADSERGTRVLFTLPPAGSS